MIWAIFTVWGMLLMIMPLAAHLPPVQIPDQAMPAFGRDTVLVFKSSLENEPAFVVRIAEFSPNRYVEWEDAITQGTIFMLAKAVTNAHEYVNWRLYEGGVDTLSKNATTLWLSQRIFRELKEKQKIKVTIDALPTWMALIGNDQMAIEVNRSSRLVSVVKTRDERGTERWFLDMEDNPLLVNFLFRNYQQKLISITTDRPNTLRWIKDKKKINRGADALP
jgi:hypothetical protein